MRQDEINALRHEAEIASRTPGMTKVSLDDIGSPNGVRQQLQAAFEKSLRGHESAEVGERYWSTREEKKSFPAATL